MNIDRYTPDKQEVHKTPQYGHLCRVQFGAVPTWYTWANQFGANTNTPVVQHRLMITTLTQEWMDLVTIQKVFLPEGVRVVRAGEGEDKVTKELVGTKEVGIVSIDEEEEVTNVTREETDTGGKNSESSTGEESMVIGPLLVEDGSTDFVSSLSMLASTLAPMASVVSSIGSLGSGDVAGEGVEMLDICFFSKQNLVSLLS